MSLPDFLRGRVAARPNPRDAKDGPSGKGPKAPVPVEALQAAVTAWLDRTGLDRKARFLPPAQWQREPRLRLRDDQAAVLLTAGGLAKLMRYEGHEAERQELLALLRGLGYFLMDTDTDGPGGGPQALVFTPLLGKAPGPPDGKVPEGGTGDRAQPSPRP